MDFNWIRTRVNLLSIVPIAWTSPRPVAATNLPEFRLRSWYRTATVAGEGAPTQCCIRHRIVSPARESEGAMDTKRGSAETVAAGAEGRGLVLLFIEYAWTTQECVVYAAWLASEDRGCTTVGCQPMMAAGRRFFWHYWRMADSLGI